MGVDDDPRAPSEEATILASSEQTVMAPEGVPERTEKLTAEPTGFERTQLVPGDAGPGGPEVSGVDATVLGDAPVPTVLPTDGENGEPRQIGRFVVLRRLGAGGMGLVFACFDEDLDRKVAVKLLRPMEGGTLSPDASARLVREAQALARLSHPNVIQVYEVGTWRKQVFVAMEFVDGATFKQWQKDPDLEWTDVLKHYVAAGRGLEAAHEAGIIHRDFKPDNVLLGHDGRVRVLDFGLATETSSDKASTDVDESAKTRRREEPRPLGTTTERDALSVRLTQTGTIMGTPAYMAPEQHEGRRTDARTDQFSFCVSLYEGLYGERPFAGDTLPTLAHAVMSGNVSEAPAYAQVPNSIRQVVLKGLSTEPEQRYPSMAALLAELDRSAGSKRKKAAAALGALAVAGGIAFAVPALLDSPSIDLTADRGRVEVLFDRARERGEELERASHGTAPSEHWNALVLAHARDTLGTDPTESLGSLRHLSSEHPGWLVAARAVGAEAIRLGVARRTLQTGPLRDLEISETGERVGFATETSVEVLDVPSGDQQRVRTELDVKRLALSRDGRHVAVVDASGAAAFGGVRDGALTVAPGCPGAVPAYSDAGEVAFGCADGRIVDGTGAQKGKGPGAIRHLESRGASWYVLADDASGGRAVYRSDEAGPLKKLVALDRTVERFELDRDGKQIYALVGARDVRSWAVADGKETTAKAARAKAYATLGRRLALATDTGLAVVDAARETQRPLIGHAGPVVRMIASRDGSVLATVDGTGSLRVWMPSVGEPEEFGGDSEGTAALAFTPDGAKFVTGGGDGTVRRWTLGQLARGEVLGKHTAPVRLLALSPNGRYAATATSAAGARVWDIETGARAGSVAADGKQAPRAIAWSEDSSMLAVAACTVGEACAVSLHRVDADEVIELEGAERAAVQVGFSADGGHLAAVVPTPDRATELWLYDVKTKERISLLQNGERPERILGFAFLPDGLRAVTYAEAGISRGVEVWQWSFEGAGDVLRRFESPTGAVMRASVLLVEGARGTASIWDLARDEVHALSSIPKGIDEFHLSPDRASVLLRPVEGDAQLLHLGSRVRRRVPLGEGPVGLGLALVEAPEEKVRILRDPTPAEPRDFLDWVARTTDRQVTPEQLLSTLISPAEKDR